jgi:hypothetical protein
MLNNSSEELGKEIVRLQQIEVEKLTVISQQAAKIVRIEDVCREMEKELERLRQINANLQEMQGRSDSQL